MKWLIGVFLAYSLCVPEVSSQVLSALAGLPVQWQKEERWLWQGQELLSQRFNSQYDLATMTQYIQKRLSSVDLRIQRLTSSWLLSFDDESSHRHYLVLLSAQSQGTEGWLSSMQLTETEQNHTAALLPPSLFAGLYQHSWSLRHSEAINEPLYFLLQPVSNHERLLQQLNSRLEQEAWQGGSCVKGSWCQWHNNSQKLWLWTDPKQDSWHVLWWPKLRGVQ